MVVQHNMQAANASRMLGVTTGNQAKSTEKLSSGYKINRAADDAAGLSISEKMRKQIRGLDQASTNAQDGVSAVQTAEGALTEVHSMLQRMNELAVQASNGTNSETDRDSIQDEIEQLTTEIDRVAETTKFNETYLLKGDNGTKTKYLQAHDAGLEGTLISNTTKATFTMSALKVGDTYTIGGTKYEIGAANATAAANAVGIGITAAVNSLADGSKVKIGGTEYTITTDKNKVSGNKMTAAAIASLAAKELAKGGKSNKVEITGFNNDKAITGTMSAFATLNAGEVITIDGKSYTIVTDDERTDIKQAQVTVGYISKNLVAEGTTIKYNGNSSTLFSKTVTNGVDQANKTLITASVAYKKVQSELKAASSVGATKSAAYTTYAKDRNGTDISEASLGKTLTSTATQISFQITRGTVDVQNALSFNLHVGSDADMTNKIGVNVEAMDSKSLGIDGLNVSDATGKAATYAIDAISDALAAVSKQRSALGAVQNRLEHTIANVDNVVENTNAAESRIRDTDMADEMVTYSKNNILAQAGQSMLAQANQSTQGALSLLG